MYCDTWSFVAESFIPQMAKSSAWFPVFGRDTSTPRFVKAFHKLNSFPEIKVQKGSIRGQIEVIWIQIMIGLTGEFSIVILVEECKSSLRRSMSHGSIMPSKFWLVESHWTVTIKVVHVFHHNLGKVKGDWGCVGGPVEPSYLRWIPESWFWSASSWFKKSNSPISICITPFEIWKVVVSNDCGIQIFVAINFWNGLNSWIKTDPKWIKICSTVVLITHFHISFSQIVIG